MRHPRFLCASIALLLAIGPIAAAAHHSVAALFDRDAIIEAEGELTRVFWRNPHVRIWMTDANGKDWQIESGSVATLERYGITRNLFVEGQIIRTAGNPSRRSDDSLYATNVLLSDGREVLMGLNATARWSNETIDFEERDPLAVASVIAAEESADGIFRVWSTSEPQRWTVNFTEAAEADRAAWDAIRDDPRLRCIAPGMVDAMVSPYPIELALDPKQAHNQSAEAQFDRIRGIESFPDGLQVSSGICFKPRWCWTRNRDLDRPGSES